jgi:CRISPR-associated protein Csx10
METTLALTFTSEWLVGSGLGDGHLADSCLVRDSRGLLFIPGRAVKGALREGAHRLGLGREDLKSAESKLFGVHCWPAQKGQLANSFNQPGLLHVGSGRLPSEVEELLLAQSPERRRRFVGDLTVRRAMTALNDEGQVKDGSLRVLECGVAGLTFFASLSLAAPSGVDEGWLKHYLRAVCAMVKSVGGHRSRGFGRCRAVLSDAAHGPASLPPKFDAAAWGGV